MIAIDSDVFKISRVPRLLFVATICAGSFLLFLVQPMVARMALPRLGGAPAVWNSAMLVYQALLLGGYAYAHWLGRFSGRRQALIHLSLFVLAALSLPIGLGSAVPPADADPLFWVPGLLLASIGPLFFIVSAQAPLMQRWFTLSGGHDPYPLYAASNLGSFAGLLAYPLVVEPLLPVAQQSLAWSLGYAALLVLVGVTALKLPRIAPAALVPALDRSPPPTRKTFAMWVLLAAVPSGLMLSTSLHLTTDIVAIPLLWVFPLGLYLLSFSVAFSDNRRIADFAKRVAPFILLMSAASAFVDTTDWPFALAAVTLIALFVIATVLHAEMFARRPAVEHLTNFYLAMSIGGVVGGLFCAIVAPLIFNWTYEHPIIIAAAALLIAPPPLFAWAGSRLSGSGKPRILSFALVAVALLLSLLAGDADAIRGLAAIGIILIALAGFGNRLVFAGSVIALMLCLHGWDKLSLSLSEGRMERSFFGVSSIRTEGDTRILAHGTTVHGLQNLAPAVETVPTAYFGAKSGVGLAMLAAPTLFGHDARIEVVGLGAGTLACYARPGQSWRFYEIDPAVVRIARNPKFFTFLSKCLPGVPIVLGDARLTLADSRSPRADLLVIDAFSSDTVPMHLLTKEALALYRDRIGEDGLLLVHISNRYLDLTPVMASAARQGWTVVIRDNATTPEEHRRNQTRSLWVAMAPRAATIERLAAASPADAWNPLRDDASFVPWSDDYATILPVLKRPEF